MKIKRQHRAYTTRIYVFDETVHLVHQRGCRFGPEQRPLITVTLIRIIAGHCQVAEIRNLHQLQIALLNPVVFRRMIRIVEFAVKIQRQRGIGLIAEFFQHIGHMGYCPRALDSENLPAWCRRLFQPAGSLPESGLQPRTAIPASCSAAEKRVAESLMDQTVTTGFMAGLPDRLNRVRVVFGPRARSRNKSP